MASAAEYAKQMSAVLTAARTGAKETRGPAEQQLAQLEGRDLGTFFGTLAKVLSLEHEDLANRQLAGLLMKLALDATDDVLRENKARRWLKLPDAVRKEIKQLVVNTLASKHRVASHTASQVIAKIGSIEIRVKQWMDLIPMLVDTVNEITLECLGYLCEELPAECVSQELTNKILFAIVTGMAADKSDGMRKTACVALMNSLDFASGNMARKPERQAIMDGIFGAVASANEEVRRCAFECLSRAADLYYDHLRDHMVQACNKTVEAVQKDSDVVGRAALEFWSTLGEQELIINERNEEAQMAGLSPVAVNYNYCKTALPLLVPMLTTCMTNQDDHQDEDTWNVAMASATCLGLLAQTCGDAILTPVMNFVNLNFADKDWHKREAAILAFGSVMSGPSRDKLIPYINASLPQLLAKIASGEATADPSVLVRDTTAWTVGRICDLYFVHIDLDKYFVLIIEVAKKALKDEARVAANACFIIHNIAQAMSRWQDSKTNPLSAHFRALAEGLVLTAGREDWDENNLRTFAYDALNALVTNTADDQIEAVKAMVGHVMTQLTNSLKPPADEDAREENKSLQIHLCALLQQIMLRLNSHILVYAEQIFALLDHVFNTPDATAVEEAFMAVGALANAIEDKFIHFMPKFFPRLMKGLEAVDQMHICSTAVQVVGDVTRALEEQYAQFADETVTKLLATVKNNRLHRSVKPPIVSSFGDVALAVGPKFPMAKLPDVMKLLHEAAATVVPQDDEDLVEFRTTLRLAALEGYTGIVQGFNPDGGDKSQRPYVPHMAAFLQNIATEDDDDQTDEMVQAATALLGDICHALGPHVSSVINKSLPWVVTLVKDCSEQSDQKSTDIANFAASVLP